MRYGTDTGYGSKEYSSCKNFYKRIKCGIVNTTEGSMYFNSGMQMKKGKQERESE
jgi:hypothetical protein